MNSLVFIYLYQSWCINSIVSYILVPELVYEQSCFYIYMYKSWCINSIVSYILVQELVYKQSWFVFTCTRAGV